MQSVEMPWEINPEMDERWVEEDKFFSPGDKVVILDKRGTHYNIGYEWKPSMDKLIGRTRTVEKRIINFYGYCVGFRLKGCAGIFRPDFLIRKENTK